MWTPLQTFISHQEAVGWSSGVVLGAQSQCTVRQPCREPWLVLSWEWCDCISTAPGSSAFQVSGFISCCQTLLLLLGWPCLQTAVGHEGACWHLALSGHPSGISDGWGILGFTGCCRQAPAMWISSPDRSCLRLRCQGRGSYLSVVNPGCFRPQRTVCLASSCCSLCRGLGYLAMCPFSMGLREHRLSWMIQ